jgi:hypothetical protein
MKITRSKIRNILLEITRYEKEKGTLFNPKEDILKHVEDVIFPNYAFTMTEINKVGVNPRSPYGTPTGVCFYPLNKKNYMQLINDTLPYVSEEKFVSVVKINNVMSPKWLKFGEQGVDYADVSVLDTLGSKESIERLYGFSYARNFNSDAKIYSVVAALARQDYKKSTPQIGKEKTRILRSLGYIGAYDSNNGIIAGAEPSQIIAFEPSAYQVIATYETSEIRKNKSTVLGKNHNRQLILLSAEAFDSAMEKMNLAGPGHIGLSYMHFYIDKKNYKMKLYNKFENYFDRPIDMRTNFEEWRALFFEAFQSTYSFPYRGRHPLLYPDDAETIDEFFLTAWKIYQSLLASKNLL